MAASSSLAGAVLLLAASAATALQGNFNFTSLTSPSSADEQLGPFDWMRHIRSSRTTKAEEEVTHVRPGKTAKLEIFYETQCPACLELLNTSFRQVFENKAMRKRVDIHLYPFGNALMLGSENVSAGYHFWHEDVYPIIFMCQHGDQECLGNMIQACAIDQLNSSDLYVPFTLCMASYGFDAGIELSSYACGKELQMDMEAIKACTYSRSGNKVEAKIGAMSDDPNLQRDHVPFVMINGVHAPSADEGQLLGALCDGLSEPKPALCKSSAGKKGTGCGEGGGHTC